MRGESGGGGEKLHIYNNTVLGGVGRVGYMFTLCVIIVHVHIDIMIYER